MTIANSHTGLQTRKIERRHISCFSAWYGYWMEHFNRTGVAGAGCTRKCNAKLLKEAASNGGWKSKPKTGPSAGQKTPTISMARMASARDPFLANIIHGWVIK